jgi:hypothetical protein
MRIFWVFRGMDVITNDYHAINGFVSYPRKGKPVIIASSVSVVSRRDDASRRALWPAQPPVVSELAYSLVCRLQARIQYASGRSCDRPTRYVFSRFSWDGSQVATACFSCSPPDLNSEKLNPFTVQTTKLFSKFYRLSEKSGTNGNFNYFSYFYLQVKVKGWKAKNCINIGWKGGDFAFKGFLKAQVYAVKFRDLRRLRQRITDCCATVDSNMLSKIRTNTVKRLRKCVECRGEHTEHIMQIINNK